MVLAPHGEVQHQDKACLSPSFAGGRDDVPGLPGHCGTHIAAGREDCMSFTLVQL